MKDAIERSDQPDSGRPHLHLIEGGRGSASTKEPASSQDGEQSKRRISIDLHPSWRELYQPYNPAAEVTLKHPDLETRAGISTALEAANERERIFPLDLRERLAAIKQFAPLEERRQLAHELVDYAKIVDRIIPYLERRGIVQSIDLQTGRIVADITAFEQIPLQEIRSAVLPGGKQSFHITNLILAAFVDKLVIDTHDPTRSPKPLFFTPRTIEDVVDLKRLRKIDFHRVPWRFGQNKIDWQSELYPLADLGSGLTPQLAVFTMTLFGPKFAAAHRDRDGSLIGRDEEHSWTTNPELPQWWQLSWKDFARHYGIQMGDRRSPATSFDAQPALFAERYLKPLRDRGLITNRDFRVMTNSRSAELMFVEREFKPGNSPSVMIHGDKYFFSKRLFGDAPLTEQWKACELSQGSGLGVVYRVRNDDTAELKAMVRLVEPDNPLRDQAPSINKQGPGRVFKSSIVEQRLLPIDPKSVVRQLSNETVEQFEERTATYENFATEYRLMKELPKIVTATGERLNWKTIEPRSAQLVIAAAIRHLEASGYDPDRLRRFYERAGMDGLRALQVTEYGQELGGMVVDLGLGLPDAARQQLFDRYGAITRSVREIKTFLLENGQNPSDTLVAAITEQQFQRGKQLLERFSKFPKDHEKYLKEIAEHGADLDLFLSTVKTLAADLKQRGERLDLTTFHEVAEELRPSSELNPQERAEMLGIARDNWSRQTTPAHLQSVLDRMKAALHEPRGVRWYRLTYQGKLLSFVRFDDHDKQRPEARYAASLNVNQLAQKQSLAEAFFASTLEEETRTHPIVGWSDSLGLVTSQHLEKYGFRCTGIDRNYEGTGRTFLRIERERQGKEPIYQFPRKSLTELRQAYDRQDTEPTVSAPHVVLYEFGATFADTDPLVQRYLDNVQAWLSQGYELTNLKWDQIIFEKGKPPRPTAIYAAFEPKLATERASSTPGV